jgi:hypothetical protein
MERLCGKGANARKLPDFGRMINSRPVGDDELAAIKRELAAEGAARLGTKPGRRKPGRQRPRSPAGAGAWQSCCILQIHNNRCGPRASGPAGRDGRKYSGFFPVIHWRSTTRP